MFHRVRIDARKKIMENAQETDPVKIQNHIFFGEEARDFLSKNLIQVNKVSKFKLKYCKNKYCYNILQSMLNYTIDFLS